MFRSLVTRGLALLFLCSAPALRAVDEDLPNESSANLSTLGRKPDWSELERYQGTITHDEFVNLLEHVYATHGYNPELIKIEPDAVADPDRRRDAELFRPPVRQERGRSSAHPALVDGAAGISRPWPERGHWPDFTSRSIPVTSAGAGRKWKSAGSRSGTPRRCRRAT